MYKRVWVLLLFVWLTDYRVYGGNAVQRTLCDSDLIEYYDVNSKSCVPCNRCEPGQGRDFDATITKTRDGQPVTCYPCQTCPVGTHSGPEQSCTPCRNCELLHRKVEAPCNLNENEVCGRCMDGFFDRYRILEGKEDISLPCTDCKNADTRVPDCCQQKANAAVQPDRIASLAVFGVVVGVCGLVLIAVCWCKRRNKSYHRLQPSTAQEDPDLSYENSGETETDNGPPIQGSHQQSGLTSRDQQAGGDVTASGEILADEFSRRPTEAPCRAVTRVHDATTENTQTTVDNFCNNANVPSIEEEAIQEDLSIDGDLNRNVGPESFDENNSVGTGGSGPPQSLPKASGSPFNQGRLPAMSSTKRSTEVNQLSPPGSADPSGATSSSDITSRDSQEEEVVTNAQLEDVARLLGGRGIRRLLRKLGLPDADPKLDYLREDFKGQELVFQALRQWKQYAGNKATDHQLRDTLECIDRKDIADKLGLN